MNTTANKISKSDAVKDILFTDIFNLEEIQELQDLFSDASGVAALMISPDGTPITNPSNFCRLCNDIIRKTVKGYSNCYRSGTMIGRYNPSEIIFWPCLSGGLWDAGTSISINGKHIANWLIGQVRSEGYSELQMLLYADEIGADRVEFMKAMNEIPVMSFEKFNHLAKQLFGLTKKLAEQGYKNFLLEKQIEESDKIIKLLLEKEKLHS